DKKQLAAAKVILATLFQGIEDCRGVVLAAEFRPEGLNLRAQARFADDSPTSRLLKTETPTPLADVGRLPGGMTLYSGMRFGPRVGPLGRSLVQPFQAPAGDDAGAALIEKLQAEIAAAGPGAELAASSIDAGLNVSTYASPEKAAAAQAKLYKGLASGRTIDNVVLKERPKVTDAAQTHRGFTFTEVRLSFDLEASVAHYPENFRPAALAILKRTAREKVVNWVGTDGKVVVRLTAKDWPAARKLLDSYLDGTGGGGAAAGFKPARQNLAAHPPPLRPL